MFPPAFEFVVEGPPVSFQTRNRAALPPWRAAVRTAAQTYWPANLSPAAISLQFTILFFYRGSPIGDLDNFIKPIQDALNGLVYVDDSQITDVICRRRDVGTDFAFESVPTILLDGLTRYDDFLYVRIEPAPSATLLAL